MNTDGQTVEDKPLKMNTPSEGTGTTTSQIVLQYAPLTDLATGGDNIDILSYNTEVYDSSNTVWLELTG